MLPMMRSQCVVHAGSLWRTFEDVHLLGCKDGVERFAVLAIAVA